MMLRGAEIRIRAPQYGQKRTHADEYGDLLARIAAEVRSTRLRIARTTGSEVLALYWRIGQLILARQQAEPWGSGVIRRLSMDLRRGANSRT